MDTLADPTAISCKSTNLVGRAWAQSRIDAWLHTDDPVLLLSGAAGTGKSTLVNQLANTKVQPLAVHFCRGRVLSTTEAIPVLASIAVSLARVVPGYVHAVIQGQSSAWREEAAAFDLDAPEQVARAVLDAPDRFTAYERALRRPLSTLATAGIVTGDVVVVIDGLDEGSAGGRGTELADLLAVQYRARVPGMRLLLTTRPGPVAERFSGVPGLNLAEDPSVVDCIDEFLIPMPGVRYKERRRIAAAAQGSFVYAALAAQSRHNAIHPPADLDALYGALLADLDPVAADVLAALCGGRDAGFTTATLAAILRASHEQVDEVLATYRSVLVGNELTRPHHRCLADFVTSGGRSADGRIAAYLVGRWGGRWEECREVYALRNLLPHLADAARAAWADGAPGNDAGTAAVLRDVLADPAYVLGALATVGIDDVRSALSYARYRIAGTPADVATMRALATILREEGPRMRTYDNMAATTRQLVYAAATLGETAVAKSLSSHAGAGIQTLWATVELTSSLAPEELRGHRAAVTAVTVAADGTQAVSAAGDGTTRIWRLASGRLTQILPTAGDVAYVHTGPDAQEVVMAYTDGQTAVLDATTGDEERVIGSSISVTAFAVSGDASLGVSGDPDSGATVWDLTATPEPLLRLPRQSGPVTAVAVTADGRTAAVAAGHGEIVVWDLATGMEHLRLRHGRSVIALCLTPRADRIVVGDEKGLTVHVIDDDAADAAKQGTDLAVEQLMTHAPVTALAANPVLPSYVLFGTAMGQVVYVYVP